MLCSRLIYWLELVSIACVQVGVRELYACFVLIVLVSIFINRVLHFHSTAAAFKYLCMHIASNTSDLL